MSNDRANKYSRSKWAKKWGPLLAYIHTHGNAVINGRKILTCQRGKQS